MQVGHAEHRLPRGIHPEIDPTKTTFHMYDATGESAWYFNSPSLPVWKTASPSDLYGSVVGDEFHATEMLMKCPSKYNENNHVLMGEGLQTEG